MARLVAAAAAIAVGLPLLLLVLCAASQPAGCSAVANTTKKVADIPPNYLNLYLGAQARYGVPWYIIAGIGKEESDHGRSTDPGVHSGTNSAGAMGPMQFLGGTWAEYGVDGDGDGVKNPYDPADAIPSAANMLKADGVQTNPRAAIFDYNHATWYVDQVLAFAAQYRAAGAGLAPGSLVGCTAVGAPNAVAAKVIAYAKAQIGKPYIWGGTGPEGYDCSGLAMMAYQSAGVTIPRTSDDQYWFGPHVPAGQEEPGDLVYFEYTSGMTGPGHVGIVYDTATGTMIVAPHTGAQVRYQSYKDYPGGPVGFTRPWLHAASAGH